MFSMRDASLFVVKMSSKSAWRAVSETDLAVLMTGDEHAVIC